MSQKPIGSGYFAAVSGALFVLVAALTLSDPVVKWAMGFTPLAIMRLWCAIAGSILLTWALNRIRNGDRADVRIGQDTINWVFAMIAATFGLAALFHH